MEDIKQAVRETYGAVARNAAGSDDVVVRSVAGAIGYDDSDLRAAPEGANLGLGCGNPLALADLRPGETILDLGSGAGFDCFLAANAVGAEGRVIGVDMTEEMIASARANALQGGYGNVEFRLGEVESLPLQDASVDVVISNCVITLVPDKPRAFAEAFRVLRPGGRLHVSDIVLGDELPPELLDSVAAYVNCIAGAVPRADYLRAMHEAGFTDVTVHSERDAAQLLGSGCCTPPAEEEGGRCEEPEDAEPGCCCASDGEAQATCRAEPEEPECGCGASLLELPEGLVVSITVSARKPGPTLPLERTV